MSSSAPLPLIGLMGGTFDPIHHGHLRMAEELASAIGLSQVRFIPAALPPHKAQPGISAQQRAQMVALAIADNPRFTLDTRELQREGYSYTVDTLREIDQELAGLSSLCLLMGHDAFAGLTSWHRWQELLSLAHIIVASRPGKQAATESAELMACIQQHQVSDIALLQHKKAGCIFFADITALDISATQIRNQLNRGISPRYLLPAAVLDYIQAHGLYQQAGI